MQDKKKNKKKRGMTHPGASTPFSVEDILKQQCVFENEVLESEQLAPVRDRDMQKKRFAHQAEADNEMKKVGKITTSCTSAN